MRRHTDNIPSSRAPVGAKKLTCDVVNSISVTEGCALRSYDWLIFTFLRSDWLERSPHDIWACGFCFSPWCPESFSVTMHHASPALCQQSEFLEIFTGDRLAPSLRHLPMCKIPRGKCYWPLYWEAAPSLVSCINHWLHAKNNIESLKVTTISYFLR